MGFHGGFVENVGRGGGGNRIIPLLQLGMQAQRFQAQQDQIKKQEALQAQEQARLNTEIDIFSSPGFLSLSEANKGKTIRDLQTQGLLKENGRITNGGLQQYTQSVLAKTELFSVFAENEVAEQRQRVIKSFQDLRKAREIDPTNAPKIEKLQKAFEFLQAEQESLVQGTTAQLKVLAENDQKEAGNIRLNEMIKKARDPSDDMTEADKIAVADTARQSGRPGAAKAIIKLIQDVKQFRAFELSLGEESKDPLIQGFKAAGDFGSVAKRFEKLEGGGEVPQSPLGKLKSDRIKFIDAGFTEEDPAIQAIDRLIDNSGRDKPGNEQGLPNTLEAVISRRISKGEITFEEGNKLLQKKSKDKKRLFKSRVQDPESGENIVVITDETGARLGVVGKAPKGRTETVNVSKLRKEFKATPIFKAFNVIDGKFKQMEKALERSRLSGSKIATDQALITLFNKMTDEESVVRESEYLRTAESQAFMNFIKGKIEKISSGGAGLTDEERQALVDMGRDFREVLREKFDEEVDFFVDESSSSGIKPFRVVGKFFEDSEKRRGNTGNKRSLAEKFGVELE